MARFHNELLKTNVKSKKIAEKILIYGSCIAQEYPEMLRQFRHGTAIHTCLEKEHINKVAWKILNIFRINKPKEVAVLTIDGSPHCVQLHYALEDVKKIFQDLVIKHYVIEDGKLIEVNAESVRTSRHLSRV
jgi:hypothetical protein